VSKRCFHSSLTVVKVVVVLKLWVQWGWHCRWLGMTMNTHRSGFGTIHIWNWKYYSYPIQNLTDMDFRNSNRTPSGLEYISYNAMMQIYIIHSFQQRKKNS
jgi:hypothetical protein